MIVKTFELSKKENFNSSIFLLYGVNEGFKNEIIEKYFINNLKVNVERYEENEILNNDDFISGLMNKSLFENEKLIIISRLSEKILKIIELIIEKKISGVTLILNSKSLDKKSKLRNFFEKDKNLVCIPFYEDDKKTLISLANSYFRAKKKSISNEAISILIDRCNGDRKNLYNELNKLTLYLGERNKINTEDVVILTNLSENFSVAELVDNCLSKNSTRTIKILNENIFSADDSIIIIRSLLSKSKRILSLKKDFANKSNVDQIILSYKPPIFWKEKEVVKKQLQKWSIDDAEKLIFKINDIELMAKKNQENSINIISDFILETSR
tara:strand:+ start:132 stop:1112 length:981 start_codon:yes stop_codon:yes gene_type:complete